VRLALVALALGALASGCGGHAWDGLWHEDFEVVCDGAPCGWTQVAGPTGAATWIETGPSEHGLLMTGLGVGVAISPAGLEQTGSDAVSSLKAHVVARCDRGAQLSLIVTVRNAVTSAQLDVSGTATFPSEWDGTRTTFTLFANDATNSTAQFDDVVTVVLHKEGPGSCEVDYVSLSGQLTPFPE
jgi:hypothetical protein